MKTVDDLFNDQYGAMKVLAEYLDEQGYKVRRFTNLDGDETVAVEVKGLDEEIAEYVAVFERI